MKSVFAARSLHVVAHIDFKLIPLQQTSNLFGLQNLLHKHEFLGRPKNFLAVIAAWRHCILKLLDHVTSKLVQRKFRNLHRSTGHYRRAAQILKQKFKHSFVILLKNPFVADCWYNLWPKIKNDVLSIVQPQMFPTFWNFPAKI